MIQLPKDTTPVREYQPLLGESLLGRICLGMVLGIVDTDIDGSENSNIYIITNFIFTPL